MAWQLSSRSAPCTSPAVRPHYQRTRTDPRLPSTLRGFLMNAHHPISAEMLRVLSVRFSHGRFHLRCSACIRTRLMFSTSTSTTVIPLSSEICAQVCLCLLSRYMCYVSDDAWEEWLLSYFDLQPGSMESLGTQALIVVFGEVFSPPLRFRLKTLPRAITWIGCSCLN